MDVTARVVSVRRRSDGTYAVTLGPAPELFWMRTNVPPKIGQKLHVRAESVEERPLRDGSGSVTVLEGGELTVVPDTYARRVVSPEWVKRCHAVMDRPLFEHQVEGAAWLAERFSGRMGSILADQPGLGKTGQTLCALVASRCLPAIIVCPASLKHSWAREVHALKLALRVHILRGGSRQGRIKPAHLIILNYEVMRSREAQLAKVGAKAIVFDEGHCLKEPSPSHTHRAAVGTRIAHRIGNTLMVTGTPILNSPRELWRPLFIVNPTGWPSFDDYRDEYCKVPSGDDDDDIDPGRTIVTSHGEVAHLDELHARVGPLMLRRLKNDVLKSLPPKKRRSVLVGLSAADQHHYARVERDVVTWLRQMGYGARASSAGRGSALVKLNMLRRIAASGKLRKALPGYLKRWFEVEKRQLVIFGFHREVLHGVHRICQSLGLRRTGIQGKDTAVQRQNAVDVFNAGRADVFIAPIRSAGVGLNLQRRCSDVLYLERIWTPSLMTQSEDRVHRIGSRRQVTITLLDAKGTVDQHMAKVLEAKQRVIDATIDDIDHSAEDAAEKQTTATIDDVISAMLET